MTHHSGKPSRLPWRTLVVAPWFVVALLARPVPGAGAADESVDSGRKALVSSTPDPPWYDAASDGIGRLHVKPASDTSEPSRKEYRFNPKIPVPTEAALSPLVILAWGALAAILVGLAYLLVRAFVKSENDRAAFVEPQRAEAAPRVEELPVRVPRGTSDLLGEAHRHYDAGNYAEAIIYFYSYQLLELDRHQCIRLARGKTNRQYLGEISGQDAVRGILEQTMITFENVFFGNRALDRAGFEACWSRLDEFHALVQQVNA